MLQLTYNMHPFCYMRRIDLQDLLKGNIYTSIFKPISGGCFDKFTVLKLNL